MVENEYKKRYFTLNYKGSRLHITYFLPCIKT